MYSYSLDCIFRSGNSRVAPLLRGGLDAGLSLPGYADNTPRLCGESHRVATSATLACFETRVPHFSKIYILCAHTCVCARMCVFRIVRERNYGNETYTRYPGAILQSSENCDKTTLPQSAMLEYKSAALVRVVE